MQFRWPWSGCHLLYKISYCLLFPVDGAPPFSTTTPSGLRGKVSGDWEMMLDWNWGAGPKEPRGTLDQAQGKAGLYTSCRLGCGVLFTQPPPLLAWLSCGWSCGNPGLASVRSLCANAGFQPAEAVHAGQAGAPGLSFSLLAQASLSMNRAVQPPDLRLWEP